MIGSSPQPIFLPCGWCRFWKIGGTWRSYVAVENAKSKRKFEKLHHLFCPREDNKIPSASMYISSTILPRANYHWEISEFGFYKKKGISFWKYYSDFIYRFGFPILLALVVFSVGWKGYLLDNNNSNKHGNAFFAANL